MGKISFVDFDQSHHLNSFLESMDHSNWYEAPICMEGVAYTNTLNANRSKGIYALGYVFSLYQNQTI